jgi:ribonuclease P protein component
MHTLKKNERLANHQLQSLLFKKGNHFFLYPIRVQWICLPKDRIKEVLPLGENSKSARFDYPVKCLISASKRQLKKAVQRNRAKRLIKEAYRKNKCTLYTFLNTKEHVVLIALIYTARDLLPCNTVEKTVQDALQKLSIKLVEQLAEKDNN